MFTKAYKLKSTNTLKNTEKKQLAQRVRDEFPGATEEMVRELVPAKATCSYMRLVLHSGKAVGVFAADGEPLMIETEEGLVPTVCALWKAPDLLPALTIHTPVLTKLKSGVPLYLPGVVFPGGGSALPMFPRGCLLSVCTQDNQAAALVGRALMSSGDMLLKAEGVCLSTLHVEGDTLCKEGKFSRIVRPRRGPPGPPGAGSHGDHTTAVHQLSSKPAREEWPSLGPPPAPAAPAAPPAPNEPRLIADAPPPAPPPYDSEAHVESTMALEFETMAIECSEMEEEGPPCPPGAPGPPAGMDGLLQWCLLSFLKLEARDVPLPIKTSLLYRNHLIPLCPAERSLDVKKSSYKKMGKFLEAMQKEGLVEVRELEKGVDAVVAASTSHPLVRKHVVPEEMRERVRAPGPAAHDQSDDYRPPVVREMYCVTAHVLELFAPHRKGAALTGAETRAALTQYVRTRGLAAPEQRGAVVLDRLLAKAVGRNELELMRWEELMPAVQGRMTLATELRFADGAARLSKARLEPVRMQVATRSGNKKVTLVSNLEAYGFQLSALSAACQHGVGAACGVTRSPGAKCDQLMLQGDQTHYVAKLLIEKYGLPKKFVEGADKALNKKK